MVTVTWITVVILIIYDRHQPSQGSSTGRRGYLYYDGSGFGLLNSSGNWALRIDGGNANAEVYRTFYANSIQANILYDRNNTSYYFDGASAHSTRFEGVSNRTMAYMNLPGHTRNSGELNRARPRRTSDTNYWTGSMGWGRQDMNVVSTFGSGFIDSWSNPPNQPSGTSHWVGTQAFHYRNSNTSGYGWQMVGGPIENLRFRSSWPSWRSWRTIPILDVNSTNGGSMYAGRYYDSNSTGYYMDPASTSNYSTSQQNGYHTFLNYGVGVTGTYTSTRLQQVFAMGSSYRMRSDGNATNNMYGIAWSHPNAGSKGGANNLNDHGLLIINNGSFRAAISSRAVFSSDVRGTLFYDYNNTGYYVDPSSSGTAVRIAGDILCDANYGKGMVGVYASTRYQHVWSMGAAYRTNASGTSAGNIYGLTWTHTNVGTGTNQSISGLSHQLQHRMNGTLYCAFGNGIWTRGNIIAYSDIAVKTNLEIIPDALSKILQLNGYTYERTDYVKDVEDPNAPDKLIQAGVVAQEVEKVLPEVVSGQEGNKAVAYGNMIALVIEGMKEQQTIINNQQQEINDLKDMVSKLLNKLS